ncbi:MAG TPA: hypothetical protein VL793_07035, partial [Patescibacteria group bacterium]|nr:hypothetical protein [Patescibacteria group bacterium]
LTQPVARRKLWTAKTVVLATALASILLALFISNHIRVDSTIETLKHTVWRNAFDRPNDRTEYFVRLIAGTRRGAFLETLTFGGLMVLVGFAGGLWTTLLLRQVTAAFWLTLLVPTSLMLLVGKLLGNFPEPVGKAGVIAVLIIYSITGLIWAKRLFLGAQDTQWTGGVVSFPVIFTGTPARNTRGSRSKKVLRALLVREFDAQFVNLLLAAGILVLHLLVIAFRKLNPDYLAVHRSTEMTLEAFPILWLAMPLLIGSVAVAEERKSGTLSASLCLPASRAFQFFTRLFVTMFLGIVCGGVFPLLIEYLAGNLGLGHNPGDLAISGKNWSTMMFQVFGASAISGLAFYGSSLARNTLQAIGLGVLACLAGCLVGLGAIRAGELCEVFRWSGPLVQSIGWPILLLTWLLLTFRNSQQLQLDARNWSRNGIAWLAAIVVAAGVTTTLYHRAWEAWMPQEPEHRSFPTVLRNNGEPFNFSPHGWASRAKIQSSSFRTAALLPDGHLWLSQPKNQAGLMVRTDRGIVITRMPKGASHSGFVEGSNWKDVAVSWNQTFAIKKDGSLWNLSALKEGEFAPERIGQSSDWDTLCAGVDRFCALKVDGTLWRWGLTFRGLGANAIPGEMSTPVQVGTEADWAALCSSQATFAAFKPDSSVWRWNGGSAKHSQPEPWLTGPCSNPVSIALNDQALACVCPDGTLWLGCDSSNSQYARLTHLQPKRGEMVRWGNDSDWKEIHWVSWNKAVAIKRDGSLWEWNLNEGFSPWSPAVWPTMPSRYVDWVCAGSQDDAFLTLAQDGSLCLWGEPMSGAYYGPDGYDPSRWLMPSRIKARLIENLSPPR